MIVFKILLVLGLCLPVAILAGYLINNLMSEYTRARKTMGQMWADADCDRESGWSHSGRSYDRSRSGRVYDRSRSDRSCSGRSGGRRSDLTYRRYERNHR